MHEVIIVCRRILACLQDHLPVLRPRLAAGAAQAPPDLLCDHQTVVMTASSTATAHAWMKGTRPLELVSGAASLWNARGLGAHS